MWGSRSISWHSIGLAAEYMCNFNDLLSRPSVSELEKPIHMRARNVYKSMSLLGTLQLGRRLQATDPLDHVYAMLGMPGVAPWAHLLGADYEKSPVELYCCVQQLAFSESNNLDALSYVDNALGISDDFPSWIPMWNKKSAVHPQLNKGWDACGGTT